MLVASALSYVMFKVQGVVAVAAIVPALILQPPKPEAAEDRQVIRPYVAEVVVARIPVPDHAHHAPDRALRPGRRSRKRGRRKRRLYHDTTTSVRFFFATTYKIGALAAGFRIWKKGLEDAKMGSQFFWYRLYLVHTLSLDLHFLLPEFALPFFIFFFKDFELTEACCELLPFST